MLSYSLTGCALVLGCALGCAMVACYRAGLRDGMSKAAGTAPAPVLRSGTRAKVHADADSARLDAARLDAVLDNIDSYDGTPTGQKEVPI